MEKKLEVMFMPSPGMGHVISMVELAKKLDPGRFSITILIIPHLVPAWASALTAYMDSVVISALNIRFHELPHLAFPSLTHTQRVETFITGLIDAHRPLVKDAISSHITSPGSAPIAALILDFFCTSMIDVADEFNVPAYIYFTSNAAMLGSMLYLPTMHVKVPSDFKDVEGDLHFPGLPPVPPHYLPGGIMDKTDMAYTVLLNHGQRFRDAKGFIVNTFAELEPRQMQVLIEGECLPDHPMPPIFPVGPLLAKNNAGTSQHRCIEWLDGQAEASVVVLCFGSMGSFEAAQAKEMAMGLERSGKRFLWSLRSPLKDGFPMPTDADLEEVLPPGFLERTKGRGLVWPSWVPQMEILAHPAVGGFVTHCGWNSSLESLWCGVPMLGWPLYAEQALSFLHMARGLGVALELRLDYGNGGFVSAEELERGVRCLMEDCEEGRRVRAKVMEMKAAGRRAMMERGSSYAALMDLMGELAKKHPVAEHNSTGYPHMTPEIIAA